MPKVSGWLLINLLLAATTVLAVCEGEYVYACAYPAALVGRFLNLLAINANYGEMPVYCKRKNMMFLADMSPRHCAGSLNTPMILLGDIIDTKVLGVWSVGDVLIVPVGFGLTCAYIFRLVTTLL